MDPPLLVDQSPVGEAAEGPEPDREGLAVRPPFVAPELGHHRQGQRGVPDQHDEQRRGAGEDDELEPDVEREADDGRPATETLGVVGDRPALDTEPAQDPGADVVEGRERIEEVPGRSDQRADDRQSDPAVDPQEERRDVSVARVPGDPLGDDPDPADQSQRPQRVAQPRRWQGTLGIQVGRRRPHVADDHEDE